jgi:hypothetical protein
MFVSSEHAHMWPTIQEHFFVLVKITLLGKSHLHELVHNRLGSVVET